MKTMTGLAFLVSILSLPLPAAARPLIVIAQSMPPVK